MKPTRTPAAPPPAGKLWDLNFIANLVTAGLVGVTVVVLCATALPPADPPSGFHLRKFEQLLAQDQGRHKPIDTVVRCDMLILSKKEEFKDGSGQMQPGTVWLLDTMAEGLANMYKGNDFIAVDDPAVVGALGLKPNPQGMFRLKDVQGNPRLREVMEEFVQAKREGGPIAPELMPFVPVVRQILEREQDRATADKINANLARRKTERALVFRIENPQVLSTLGLPQKPGSWRYSPEEIFGASGFDQFTDKAKAVRARPEKEWDVDDGHFAELYRHLVLAEEVKRLGGPRLAPPREGADTKEWQFLGMGVINRMRGMEQTPEEASLERIVAAYGTGDAKKFNEEVDSYSQTLDRRFPSEASTARLEAYFNYASPFYSCLILYALVGVLVVLSWCFWVLGRGQDSMWVMTVLTDACRRSAFWLVVLTFVIHTAALVIRCWIQGRPPVTNLYSSAVFIGWGAVALGLLLECVYRVGVGTVVASVLGFVSTYVALYLSLSGDTMEQMRAVLDTNFWLATHVICVTLGYVATLVAGAIAIIYLVVGMATPWLDRDLGKKIGQMMYGVICFAMLLSFTGTILGGIWADQSWGRFWGWDPKENGALLIVIMNALVLHARWGGMVKERGMAVLALVGSMVTVWSWFGTNQLGIGLHAYGFNKTLVSLCVLWWGVHLVLITVALALPRSYWRSQDKPAVVATPAPQTQAERKRDKKARRRGGDGVALEPA